VARAPPAGYLRFLGERFGATARASQARRIWIHAVSVGETRAAAPLVDALLARYPEHRILVTHMTPTGRATGESIWGDRVERAWLPYDLGFATRRFFTHWRPEAGILLETEIWPRLIEAGARAHVPVMLANARLSERSARRYRRVPSLTAWAFGNLAGVAAQTASDAQRLASIGARSVAVLGNVKFDLAVPPEAWHSPRGFAKCSARDGACGSPPARGRRGSAASSMRSPRWRPTRVLFSRSCRVTRSASTRWPRPRRKRGFTGRARAATARPVARDSARAHRRFHGRDARYYGAADVAILGGSFLPYGGQNLIEACAMGCPVIMGPIPTTSRKPPTAPSAQGAALRVAGAREALEAAASISADDGAAKEHGRKGRAFVAAHRGARRAAGGVDRRDRGGAALAAPERAVHRLDVRLGERAGRGLQAQRRLQVVVARLLQVAARLEHLLLRVQHVDAGAHADVAAEDGGIELALDRGERLLERAHLRDAVAHVEEILAHVLRDVPLRALQVLLAAIAQRDRLAHARLREPARVDRHASTRPTGAGIGERADDAGDGGDGLSARE
jgi:3-deoxy-D-manno-octulosonic-acid transferase